MSLSTIIKLFRAKHWVKNGVIVIPAFFAGVINEPGVLTNLLVAFGSFSLVASSVYILNDILDKEADKRHEEKSKRPIASGAVKVSTAWIWLLVLLGLGISVAYLYTPVVIYLLGAYFMINVMYSLFLKHMFLVDISIIAIGFLLRVFSGGLVAEVPVSDWLVIMTFLISLFLGLAKRRDDAHLLQVEGKAVRKNITKYNIGFIDIAMSVMAAVVIVAYIMYTVSPEVKMRTGSEYVYTTSFFVVLGILKYLHRSIAENKPGSPIKVLFSDHLLQFLIATWLGTFFILLYLGK